MKKRKKKGDDAAPSETTQQDAHHSEAVTDASEEPTVVSDLPVPDLALRETASANHDPLDVPIEVNDEGLTERTHSDFVPRRDAYEPSEVEKTPVIPTELLEQLLPDIEEEPTAVGGLDELAALAARSVSHPEPEGEATAQAEPASAEPAAEEAAPAVDSSARLENIVESLIFAADRPLAIGDLKRLVNERDTKKVAAAVEAVKARHQDTGIQLLSVAGGWQFRTHPENGAWVSKLLTGRPVRLSRALLETLAIIAYRQPITRPEVDEIRGVDCGPVIKTLLDRGLVRMIGKREDVGRPLLYGTTPEFLRTFSLRDLTELPTLREFHELGVAEMAKVDAEAPRPAAGAGTTAPAGAPSAMPAPTELPAANPEEEDALLADLESATAAAAQASKAREADAAPPPAPETSEV